MPLFAANLSMLFTEQPFLERFAAAAEVGFRYVEVQFPYEHPPAAIRERLDATGLEQVLFNLPAGDWRAGERGIAADPDRRAEFRDGVARALEYSRVLRVERLTCLAGRRRDGTSTEEQWEALVENVRYAARELAADGRTLLVEPINAYDVPGSFLSTTGEAVRLLDEAASPNARLQFDVYHVQKMEGNLAERFRALVGRVGHVQIADNPGRHQPGTGEINYPFLLAEIDRSGYRGHVALEYVPEPDTASSLGWLDPRALAEPGWR